MVEALGQYPAWKLLIRFSISLLSIRLNSAKKFLTAVRERLISAAVGPSVGFMSVICAEDEIVERVLDGRRITPDDARELHKLPLEVLGSLADARRRVAKADAYDGRGNDVVTYIVDRNINYTNVCNVYCKFCAFYRTEKDDDHYVLTLDQIDEKLDELAAEDGVQVLLQGGHHPKLGIDFYLTMLSHIREKYPKINIHGFSPPTPFFPACGPITGSFNGLHRESNFLAINQFNLQSGGLFQNGASPRGRTNRNRFRPLAIVQGFIMQSGVFETGIHDDGKADALGVTTECLMRVRQKLIGIAPAPGTIRLEKLAFDGDSRRTSARALKGRHPPPMMQDDCGVSALAEIGREIDFLNRDLRRNKAHHSRQHHGSIDP